MIGLTTIRAEISQLMFNVLMFMQLYKSSLLMLLISANRISLLPNCFPGEFEMLSKLKDR